MDKILKFNTYFRYLDMLNKKYPYKRNDYQMINILSKLNEWDIKVEELHEIIRNQIKETQYIKEDWNW